ncbi:MAG: glycosyltransferase, partial [Elusimicrobia bacterium]|nr:glycosyltransferase [Elusimicrobiota bacterium]
MGSPEKLILGQARFLKDEISSTIAVLPDGSDAFYRAAVAEDVPAVLLPGGRVPLLAAWRLARMLRENGYDVLCTHDYKSNLVGWLAARIARCRQVAVFHGRTSHNLKMRTYEALDNLILRRTEAVVAVSEASRRKLAFMNGSVHVIRNALDPARLPATSTEDLRGAWGLGERDVLIVSAGRLSPEKGHLLLLEAFRKTLEKADTIHLAIAGEGILRPALEREVERRGLEDRVRLLGPMSDLVPLYRAADIFVLP